MLKDTLRQKYPIDTYVGKTQDELVDLIYSEITKALESVVPPSEYLESRETTDRIIYKLGYNECRIEIDKNIKNYLE